MLFHSLYAPKSPAYFNQMTCLVRRGLEVETFRRAWQRAIHHHPILRTAFAWTGLEEALQVIRRQVSLPLEEQDWTNLSEEEQQQRLTAYLKADHERGFKLDESPLMRLALIRVGTESYYLVWSFHHVLMDGWSVSLLLKDIMALYEAACDGRELQLERGRPFSEYIDWMQRQEITKAEEYWRERFKGFTSPTEWWAEGAGGGRAAGAVESYDERVVLLSEATTTRLQEVAREQHLTLNTLAQGAWALLLSRYGRTEDVIFGNVVSGRPPALPGAESMVGLFINTLPVRVEVRGEQRINEWLEELQRQQVALREYEYSPLVDVQRWSGVRRGRRMFESIFVFENYPVDKSLREQQGRLEITDLHSREQTDYGITLVVAPNPELCLKIYFDESLIDAASVSRMLGHVKQLLEQMAANIEQRVGQLSLLNEAERHQLLVEWNETQVSASDEACLHELFEAQVARTPDAVAFIHGDTRLTYRELNLRANLLAHHLMSLGVGPEVLVGVCLERSLELVASLLAILKAGGAYVPLDPSYPQERLSFMLEDSGASVLLTKKGRLELTPERGRQVVYLDAERTSAGGEEQENPPGGATHLNPAYVIYTSGSTGRPKGVVGLHRGMVNRFRWMWQTFPFGAEEVCCQKTSIGFGDSIWEIFGPLLQGVPIVIIPDDAVKDPHRLVQTLAEHQVTRIVLVPSLLRAILESVDNLDEKLPALKYCVTSGEALPADLYERFGQLLPGTTLLNLYGSSELSADVTWFDTGVKSLGYSHLTIGRPIANTQIYLLDANLDPVPVGVAGEVYVGGMNLARGYLHGPDLTAEKFVPHHFSTEPGARLYKTGDLARWYPSGNIEYLGRVDHQVKVRGYRIELGEIECVLKQQAGIRQALVMAHKDESGGNRLAAYYVAAQEPAPTTTELRNHLKNSLPEYMIPADFLLLDAMPLTPSGKVNRLALPIPNRARLIETELVMPRTAIERAMAEIWQRVLGLEKVGVEDNFFELGGHSILMIKVQSQLRELFGREIPLVQIFQYSTISSLAEHLSDGETPSYDQYEVRAKRRKDLRNRRKQRQ
jgi:surfactin family lipopeptide synthetase C